ncbi:MAG: transketolase C-terminal domain-containing protein [Candidatus Pacearchaeota archaeon]
MGLLQPGNMQTGQERNWKITGGKMSIDKLSMRDSFWNRIYDLASKDKNIILVCADMGAPSLDKFRENLSAQYFNVGIAEHNMLAVAAGLSKEGKNVFTYAIAPFATSRCHEFTKLNCGLMKIPIKIVGVGAGFGYDDSGPTHHTTEDIAIMRAIPNLEVYCPADSFASQEIAEMTAMSGKPAYIRLDRHILPIIYDDSEDFNRGFKELKIGKDVCIVSTGNMTHKAMEASKRYEKKGVEVGVIDIYRLKPLNPDLTNNLMRYKKLLSLEEHLLDGGLGSIIAETIVDNDLPLKLKRMGLKDYVYAYGGRRNIQKLCGIDTDSVANCLDSLIENK